MKRNQIYRVIGITLFGIGCIVTFPYMFAKLDWSGVNFKDSGTIGDTIGGIATPIISLIGAILVYMSFSEQKRSNDILIYDRKFTALQSEFKELMDDFKNFKITIVQHSHQKDTYAITAFINFMNSLKLYTKNELTQQPGYIEINHFFIRYNLLFDRTIKQSIQNEIETKEFLENLKVYYETLFKDIVTNNSNIILDADGDSFKSIIDLHKKITGEELQRNSLKDALKKMLGEE